MPEERFERLQNRYESSYKRLLGRNSSGILAEREVSSSRFLGDVEHKSKMQQDHYLQGRRRKLKKPKRTDRQVNYTLIRRRIGKSASDGDVNITELRRKRSNGVFFNDDINMTELRRRKSMRFDTMDEIMAPYEKHLNKAVREYLMDDEEDSGLQAGVAYGDASLKTADAVYKGLNNLSDYGRNLSERRKAARSAKPDSGKDATKNAVAAQKKRYAQQAVYDKSKLSAKAEAAKTQVKAAAAAIKEKVVAFVKAAAEFIAANAATIGIILLILIAIIGIVAIIATVSTVVVSYLSEDTDLIETTKYLTSLDAEILLEIGKIPAKPEYKYRTENEIEEFRYYLGNSSEKLSSYMDVYQRLIVSDPRDILPYLTVAYEDFKFSQVSSILSSVHSSVFSYTEEEIIEFEEVETETVDPETGEVIKDTEIIEHHFIDIRVFTGDYFEALKATSPKPWDDNQEELFEVIKSRNGNRPEFGNPFKMDGDWRDLITSFYGYRLDPFTMYDPELIHIQFHDGLDLAKGAGTPIYAVGGGKAQTGYDSTYGIYVIITQGRNRVRYAHCSSVVISNGANVKAGELIGYVGSTGSSTGAHLHIDIQIGGESRNPLIDLSID